MNAQTATSNQKALLAEDDALIRELVSGYLERLGYRVEEASNGKEAIELIADGSSDKFDLVVTDILMPKANGEELIKAARERQRCERFLIMSGNLVELSPEEMTRRHDAAFIEKPFTFKDFEAKLHALCNLACS